LQIALVSVADEPRGVRWLRLSRPDAKNALSRALVRELARAFDVACESADLRMIVLAGKEGGDFCAGADLAEMSSATPEQTARDVVPIVELCDRIARAPVPVVAAIEGVALGGGLELALSCDVRVAGPSARFGLPEVTVGVIPGAGGTQRLPRLVGPGAAKRLILFGQIIGADEAARIGLIDLPPGDVSTLVAGLAQTLERTSPRAVRRAKTTIDRGLDLPLAEGLAVERAAFDAAQSSSDRTEGVRAFLEKREAKFSPRLPAGDPPP
jgi:methylglutaconyl-CoA hydratase